MKVLVLLWFWIAKPLDSYLGKLFLVFKDVFLFICCKYPHLKQVKNNQIKHDPIFTKLHACKWKGKGGWRGKGGAGTLALTKNNPNETWTLFALFDTKFEHGYPLSILRSIEKFYLNPTYIGLVMWWRGEGVLYTNLYISYELMKIRCT